MNTVLDNPSTVPAPGGPYSHVARVGTGAGALLFVSGQVAIDDAGEIQGVDDMTAQSDLVMRQLGAILEAHGAGFDDIVNIRSYLTDLSRLAEYADVRKRYLTGTPPTSTTVEVSKLFKPDALLEVEVVAAIG